MEMEPEMRDPHQLVGHCVSRGCGEVLNRWSWGIAAKVGGGAANSQPANKTHFGALQSASPCGISKKNCRGRPSTVVLYYTAEPLAAKINKRPTRRIGNTCVMNNGELKPTANSEGLSEIWGGEIHGHQRAVIPCSCPLWGSLRSRVPTGTP
jgi:hypothetical protein